METINNTGWTKLSGKVSEIAITVSNNEKTYWSIAIPSSLGITKATSGGLVDELITYKTIKTIDGIEYNIFTMTNPTKKFNYIMK